MEVHYSLHGKKYISDEERSKDRFNGMRDFYFWEMPRIQYKNPSVQIVRHLDKMPNPFIRCWLEDGSDVLFDCFHQSREEILQRLIKTLGKSRVVKSIESEKEVNPALFGWQRPRFCMCEIVGQSPCPGTIRNEKFNDLEVRY